MFVQAWRGVFTRLMLSRNALFIHAHAAFRRHCLSASFLDPHHEVVSPVPRLKSHDVAPESFVGVQNVLGYLVFEIWRGNLYLHAAKKRSCPVLFVFECD